MNIKTTAEKIMEALGYLAIFAIGSTVFYQVGAVHITHSVRIIDLFH